MANIKVNIIVFWFQLNSLVLLLRYGHVNSQTYYGYAKINIYTMVHNYLNNYIQTHFIKGVAVKSPLKFLLLGSRDESV